MVLFFVPDKRYVTTSVPRRLQDLDFDAAGLMTGTKPKTNP
jgi:hypothetical protein